MNRCLALVFSFLVWTFLGSTREAMAHDWPQFLGPNRNGVYSDADVASTFPKDGPQAIWQKKIGQGFSGPVVASGKLILFHRVDDKEVVACRDARSGDAKWNFEYATHYRDDFGFDEGPRATPTIEAGKVYTFGAEGALHCIDLESGRKLWSVDTKQQFAAGKGFFGLACSPLVEGHAVLLNLGGRDGAGIAAFDKDSGALLWKATKDEASYSSPVIATIGGRRQALFLTRNGLVAVDPTNGKVLLEFPWRPRLSASVNAASPLAIGEEVLLSVSYDTGAVLLDLRNNQAKKIWASDEALSSHYASIVHRAGFLYGFHGRQEMGPSLRCVELRTGKVRWSKEGLRAGTVTLAGDSLLVLLEDGRLLMAAASPESFETKGEAQILPFGVRAYPALANGFFYARSKDTLVCVDLRKAP